jgi:LuxR family maltose regulon positive regulatory protein
MCAPLCDHVTGEQGAQAMLRRIEESNLFVIPLDRERTWYRFPS